MSLQMGVVHRDPDCAGVWERRDGFFKPGGFWACTRCGRSYPDTGAVARAAARENMLGIDLRDLARTGESLLSGGLVNRLRGRVR